VKRFYDGIRTVALCFGCQAINEAAGYQSP